MLCDDIGTRCGGNFVLLFFVTSVQKGSMVDIFSLKKYKFPVFLFFFFTSNFSVLGEGTGECAWILGFSAH